MDTDRVTDRIIADKTPESFWECFNGSQEDPLAGLGLELGL